jgi:site-specific recombinase XerD
MSQEIIIHQASPEILPTPDQSPFTIGEIADRYAASQELHDYQQKLAARTKRRQRDDLTLFARYLGEAGIAVTWQELFEDITTCRMITYGLVSGFVRWQQREGFAIGSINVRLATVKRYCSIAAKAHVLDTNTLALIKEVKGFSHKDGRNIDQGRETTRIGKKKAEPVQISKDQAAQLKREQPDTPQGRRDALLMCLLLDHGLRCGEIATLTLHCVNLNDETLTFYREKVNIVQIHQFTKDTRVALRRYLECVQLQPGDPLLQGSRRSGKLEGRMSERAITARVNVLGERLSVSIKGLSAHDGRHAWATFAIKAGTDVKALQDAGGWKSPVMPLRYAASGKIANAGVKLE